MKQNKLILALLTVLSTTAFADDYERGTSISQQQLQLQGQAQYQSQTGSTSASTNDIHISTPRTAASANSPSLSQYSDCPIVSPSSKAFSIFLFSVSGTTGSNINGICVAKYLGENDVMRKIACSSNREYHDANLKACK